MIQAKELRIGNFVDRNDLPKEEKVVFKIMSISDNRLHKVITHELDFKNNSVYSSECELDNLEPIPITESILTNLGFKLFPWGWVKKSENDFGVRLNVTTFSYDVSGNNPVQLNYLHQLQNLYYALTSQELPVSGLTDIN